jgi:class 3 adenylate cyclase
MVIFNAVGEPDHPRRAATTGLAIAQFGRSLAASHPGWPIFRVGVNTGLSVLGDIGAAGRRSFASIGDTTNVAARLAAVGEPGQVVVARATWEALGVGRQGDELGPTGRGKQAPVEALGPRATPADGRPGQRTGATMTYRPYQALSAARTPPCVGIVARARPSGGTCAGGI